MYKHINDRMFCQNQPQFSTKRIEIKIKMNTYMTSLDKIEDIISKHLFSLFTNIYLTFCDVKINKNCD